MVRRRRPGVNRFNHCAVGKADFLIKLALLAARLNLLNAFFLLGLLDRLFFAVKRFYFLLRLALVIIAAAAAFATQRLLLFIAGFHFFRRFLLAGIARFRILLLRLATVTTIIVAALAAVTSGTVITGVAAFVTIGDGCSAVACDDPADAPLFLPLSARLFRRLSFLHR